MAVSLILQQLAGEIPEFLLLSRFWTTLNEEHLRRIMRDYVTYHEQDRLHDALEKDSPNRRAVEQRPGTNATVISLPRLGGLHHRYAWRQAA